MEPTIPTSFIPKRPIDSVSLTEGNSHKSVSIFSLATTIIILGTLLSFGGVYLSQRRLQEQKKSIELSIANARDGLGTDFVSEMKRLDTRLSTADQLLRQHVVVTPIFLALQSTTLRSVQYTGFSYTTVIDPTTRASSVVVELSGNAKSYSTIALQSDAYAKSTLIRNPVFSNLVIDDRTGRVGFRLTFNVDMKDISYESFIAGGAGTPATGAPVLPSNPQEQ